MQYLVVLIVAFIVVGPFVMKWRKQRRVNRLWQMLCRITGDTKVATRLLDRERERHPRLDDERCLVRVIRAIQSDRR
ncbi:MAG: hypothetical protein AAGE52_30275 [Myxococcota bacterium]